MINLRGKIALVTGAARGIGRPCAIKLAALGAAVVVNYNESARAADDVVAETERSGGAAIAVQGDVSRFAMAATVVEATIDAYGRLDILVNNAGTPRDRLLARCRKRTSMSSSSRISRACSIVVGPPCAR